MSSTALTQDSKPALHPADNERRFKSQEEGQEGGNSETTLISGAYIRKHVQLRKNSKLGLRSSIEIGTKSSLMRLFTDTTQGSVTKVP